MYICIYIYFDIRAHKYAHTHTYMHVIPNIYNNEMETTKHAQVFMQQKIRGFESTRQPIHKYIDIYIHVYVFVHTHTHARTYT